MPVIQGAFSRKYLIKKSSDIQDVQNEEQGRRWADLYTCVIKMVSSDLVSKCPSKRRHSA